MFQERSGTRENDQTLPEIFAPVAKVKLFEFPNSIDSFCILWDEWAESCFDHLCFSEKQTITAGWS